MKHIPIATAILAAAVAAAATAGNASSATANGCLSKKTTINGKPATVYCGPAVATLNYQGKTYHYTHGSCERQPGFAKLELFLGTVGVSLEDNGGRQGLGITLGTSAPREQLDAWGKPSISGAKISAHGHIPQSGTFTGTTVSTATGAKVKLSGAWDCKGTMGTM